MTQADSQQPAQPMIAIAPLEREHGPWRIASADEVTVTVTAPDAKQVLILCRPEGIGEIEQEGIKEEEFLELRRLDAAANVDDAQKGKFITRLAVPPDFAAEVWAETVYAGGARKKTEAVALTAPAPAGNANPQGEAAGGSIGTDESARSDKFTGGRVRRAVFQAGEPDIRLTVNLPAFTLTFWQKGAEIEVYRIGIGRKNFPVPVGERETAAIIFNPNWIPSGSAWGRRVTGVGSYEPTSSVNLRDPLGKIKIPLGEGYLIREAAKPSDIGHLTSQGCIQMLREDLYDLAEKILAARSLPPLESQLGGGEKGSQRVMVKFDSPLLVDINYDLQVIENGTLHLYPDVYGRGAFALDSLRAELQSVGIRVSNLTDSTLQQLLDRVDKDRQFVLGAADIKRGRWDGGKVLPVIETTTRTLGGGASTK